MGTPGLESSPPLGYKVGSEGACFVPANSPCAPFGTALMRIETEPPWCWDNYGATEAASVCPPVREASWRLILLYPSRPAPSRIA